jgi:uncharacterized metal-binding protein YceD (DUF177 family)
MRLDLSEILQEVGRQADYAIQLPPLVDEDIECTQPITGHIRFVNTGGTLLARGEAATCVALPCSRCAEYFEQRLPLKLEEQFELRRLSAGPRTLQTVTVVEEDDSPIAGKLFDGHIFDLSELLRQVILLELPSRPLPPLRPDGRCAQCLRQPEQILPGAEVASVEAASDPPINPAFAKLGQLLEESAE